ncbi:hypothetical protein Hdeb2414_s0023g00641181 [Helianthus debilis subsp. tardiflorus]
MRCKRYRMLVISLEHEGVVVEQEQKVWLMMKVLVICLACYLKIMMNTKHKFRSSSSDLHREKEKCLKIVVLERERRQDEERDLNVQVCVREEGLKTLLRVHRTRIDPKQIHKDIQLTSWMDVGDVNAGTLNKSTLLGKKFSFIYNMC